MDYWRKHPDEKLEHKQRINKPDIELILERVKEENIEDNSRKNNTAANSLEFAKFLQKL